MSGETSSGRGGHRRAEARRKAEPGPTGSSRLHAREYRRFLRRVGVGALIPGTGLIAAGRRVLGWSVLVVFVLVLAGAAVYFASAGGVGLIRMGTDPDRIEQIAFGLLVVAAGWLLVAVVSLYVLQPIGLRAVQRLVAAGLVLVVMSMVVSPLSLGSRYAFTQRDFIESVFADEEDQHSLTIPDGATEEDPWAGQPRVNVLILGADSGDNRDGTRTDTIMVASIDTDTGDTALFSLPRNLQYTPMPEGPLREAYPDGYHGEPAAEYWLSSIYRNVPAEFPQYFDDIKAPGAEAMKLVVGQALGLDISYYVMVNLQGFQTLVDALGGVEMDVPYRIPTGTRKLAWGGCSEPSGWIEKGENQRLDGYHALWFARARCGPPPVDDDYERMRRQRCVIGAIAAQFNPFNVLRRYQQLASAAEDTMSTDIGRGRLDDFAELALKVQDAGIRSLPFTNEIVEYNDPDYGVIQDFVREALNPPEQEETPRDEESSGDETSPGDEESPRGEETPEREETPRGEVSPDGEDQPEGEELPDDEESPRGEQPPDDEEKADESDGAQSIAEVC